MSKNPLDELPEELESYEQWKKELSNTESKTTLVFSDEFWKKLYLLDHRIDVIIEIGEFIFANKGSRLMIFKDYDLYRDYLTAEQFNSNLKRAFDENALSNNHINDVLEKIDNFIQV